MYGREKAFSLPYTLPQKHPHVLPVLATRIIGSEHGSVSEEALLFLQRKDKSSQHRTRKGGEPPFD